MSARSLGRWLSRSDCSAQHAPTLENVASPGGYRDRGDGYDHEHFVPYRQDPPLVAIPNPVAQVPSDSLGITDLSEPPGGRSSAMPVVPRLHAKVIITNDNGDQLLHFNVSGIPSAVQQVIESAADAVRDYIER